MSATKSVSMPVVAVQKKLQCSLCNRIFAKPEELSQHKRDKHDVSKQQVGKGMDPPITSKKSDTSTPPNNTVACSQCKRSFSTKEFLQQHQRDSHDVIQASTKQPSGLQVGRSISNINCSFCNRSFSTHAQVQQHTMDRHPPTPQAQTYPCKACSKSFTTNAQLEQHQTDKHQTNAHPTIVRQKSSPCASPGQKGTTSKTNVPVSVDQQVKDGRRALRRKAIDDFYEKKVNVDTGEKKIATTLVDSTLSKIMVHVNRQTGGEIYCPNHIKAGSYPVNTKIGRADEFDTNISLKVDPKDVKIQRNGKIMYHYPETGHYTNMNIKCQLEASPKGQKIPNGFAAVSVLGNKIPDSLKYGDHLIPREIRYDLYQRIKTAINELNMQDVDLSREAHGPALTLTIRPTAHSTLKFHISVDIAISVPCDEQIANWPRKATKKAFSEKLIKDVQETGIHLVPKEGELWSVSHSKAERRMFSKIDDGNGCRKLVYKILKKHLQTCKSRSANGLSGISSHLLKTQLLWSCEKHTTPGYWLYVNRDVCLIDTMSDLENTFREGRMLEYFSGFEDLLKTKDRATLVKFADYLAAERRVLE